MGDWIERGAVLDTLQFRCKDCDNRSGLMCRACDMADAIDINVTSFPVSTGGEDVTCSSVKPFLRLNPKFCVNAKQCILKTKIVMMRPAKTNIGLICIVK